IMRLVAQFLAIACQHEHHVDIDLEGWVSRPLNVQCLQNNNFDCGVWVLATIFTVVHGKHIMGVHKHDMNNLQHNLQTMVLALPVYQYDSR
ncbi:hypothetical protein BDR06DRAFT_879872, partial [Suillus hirtellus]